MVIGIGGTGLAVDEGAHSVEFVEKGVWQVILVNEDQAVDACGCIVLQHLPGIAHGRGGRGLCEEREGPLTAESSA
jgi:hypothetical protein